VIIPTGCAQVNFIYTGASVPTGAQWTLGLDISGFIGDPAAVGAAISTNYTESNFDAQTGANCDLTGILVKFGPNATGPSALVAANEGGVGGGDSIPNIAALAHKNTEDGGHAGRGRTYFPGVQESSVVDGGALVAAYRTALQTCFDTFYDKCVADELFPVLLHGENSPLSIPSAMLGWTVDATAATQRRRLRR